jgi:hypothetical protein
MMFSLTSMNDKPSIKSGLRGAASVAEDKFRNHVVAVSHFLLITPGSRTASAELLFFFLAAPPPVILLSVSARTKHGFSDK